MICYDILVGKSWRVNSASARRIDMTEENSEKYDAISRLFFFS